MLSLVHTTTGALIATKVPNPLVSVPSILASHYLLDAIPHWDAGTGLTNGSKSIQKAIKHEIVDLFLSALLLFFFFQFGKPFPKFTIKGLAPYWGAAFAIVPDLFQFSQKLFKKEPKFLNSHTKFHKSLHYSTPKPIAGLIPQILLLILIYFLK